MVTNSTKLLLLTPSTEWIYNQEVELFNRSEQEFGNLTSLLIPE